MNSEKVLDQISPKQQDATIRNPIGSNLPTGQTVNPPKRVIKQIVSLDSKKCKELGIESNILSAMSKLSAKRITTPLESTHSSSKLAAVSEASSRPLLNKTSTALPDENKQVVPKEPKDKKSAVQQVNPNKKVHILSQVIIPGPKSLAKNLDAETISKINNKISSIMLKDNLSSQKVPKEIPTKITSVANQSSSTSDVSALNRVERTESEINIALNRDNEFRGFPPNSISEALKKRIMAGKLLEKRNRSKKKTHDLNLSHQEKQDTPSRITWTSNKKIDSGESVTPDDFKLQISPTSTVCENIPVPKTHHSVSSTNTDEDVKTEIFNNLPGDRRNESIELQNESELNTTPQSTKGHHRNKPTMRVENEEVDFFNKLSKPKTNIDSLEEQISGKTQIECKQKKVTDYFQSSLPVKLKQDELIGNKTVLIKRKRAISNYNDLIHGHKSSSKSNQKQAEEIEEECKLQSDTQLMPTSIEKRKRGRPRKSNIECDIESIDHRIESPNEHIAIQPTAEIPPVLDIQSVKLKKPTRGRKPLNRFDKVSSSDTDIPSDKAVDSNIVSPDALDNTDTVTSQPSPSNEKSNRRKDNLVPKSDYESKVSGSTTVEPERTLKGRKRKNEPISENDTSDDVQDRLYKKSVRKVSHQPMCATDHEDVPATNVSAEPEDIEPLPKSRKRGRIAKTRPEVVQDDANAQKDAILLSPDTSPPKKRGRKSKNSLVEENVVNIPVEVPSSASTECVKTEDLSTLRPMKPLKGRPTKQQQRLQEEEEERIRLTIKEFICGKCNLKIKSEKWDQHSKVHYGIYWRDGIDNPIDMENTNQLVIHINKFLKFNKNAVLTCEKCKIIKKSAVGYLSHLEICGLDPDELQSAKVKCQYCEGLYRKSSIQSHEQGFCPVRRAQESVEHTKVVAIKPSTKESLEFTDTGRIKRKSVKNSYKDLVLEGEADNNDSDDNFTCDSGASSSSDDLSTEGEVEEITTNDSDNWSTGSFDLDKKKRRRLQKKKAKEMKKMTDAVQKPDAIMVQRQFQSMRLLRHIFFSPTIKWTNDFRLENYFNESFFMDHLVDDNPLFEYVKLSDFLPIRDSPAFSQTHTTTYGKVSMEPKDKITWKQLNCGHGISDKKMLTIFCGGPILAMEWATLPSTYSVEEILAVSVNVEPTKNMMIRGIVDPIRTIIQLWSIPSTELDESKLPRILYAIDCQNGPVMCMQFCPSGGFIDTKRIGLLAIGTYDGNVDILSLPYPDDHDSKCVDDLMIRKIAKKPLISLKVSLSNKANAIVTQITWSQAKGHSIIAAGYNNGLVAIWDLNNLKPTQLQAGNDECAILLPIKLFYSGSSPISQIDLHHDCDNETRWLLIGSLDRRLKFFDLENALPIPVTTSTFKSRIRSGYWPLHWNIYFSLIDDTFAYRSGGLLSKQPNNFCQGQVTTLSFDGDPSTLAFSDWLNTSIFGNSNGDIFVNYHMQLVRQSSSTYRQYRGVISYTDIVPLESKDVKSISDQALQYGIIFCDFSTPIPLKRAKKRRIFPLNSYSTMKIDQIKVNQNANAYKTYAVGYQNGLIRIRTINAMKKAGSSD